MAEALYRARLAAIVLASASVAWACIHFWTFAYNSDYAMIGLMAKRLLDTGIVPIFVWHVGYQGTLLEVPAVAAAYRLFGISPYTLNLAPALFFFVLVAVYFRSVSITFGKSIAATAALAAVISTPELYGAILRTQPNYTQTFIYGSALIWVYLVMLRRIFEGRKPGALPLVFGILAGWGFYTYGQIVYFLAAISLHASALLFRGLGPSQTFGRLKASFTAAPFSWPFRLLNWVGAADLLLGLISLLTGIHELHLAGHMMAWSPLAAMSDGIKIAALAWVYGFFRIYWPKRDAWAMAFGQGCLGFAIGISPKLYYNWILGQPSAGKLGSGGDFPLLISRAEWFFESLAKLFNFSRDNPATFLLALGLGGIFFAFLWVQWREWRAVAQRSADRVSLLKVSPWAWMVVAVALAFLTLDSITNDSYGRYLLVLVYSAALAMAWALEAAWKSRGRALATLVSIFILAVLLNNTRAFVRELRAAPERPEWVEVAQSLAAQGPRKGYADYWIAYVATLYTQNELNGPNQITLEPIEKSYSPEAVAADVAAEPRIALVALVDAHSIGALLNIHGANYVVTQSRNVGNHAILTLEKR